MNVSKSSDQREREITVLIYKFGKTKGENIPNTNLRIFLLLYILHSLNTLILIYIHSLSLSLLSLSNLSASLWDHNNNKKSMKFGKSLSNQIEETLPEWRDKFLSYKELKKRLKLINPPVPADVDDSTRPEKRRRFSAGENMSDEEIDFLNLLEDELEKFNSFFVEKEEEYIIRLKVIF